VSVRNLLSI